MYEHKISQLISPDNWRGGTLHIEALPGETPEQLMDRVAKIHEEWFKKKYNPLADLELGFGKEAVQEIQVQKPEEHRVGILAEDIVSCKDLVTIDSYRLLVANNATLKPVWEKRRQEIVEAEKQDIFRRTEERTKAGKTGNL